MSSSAAALVLMVGPPGSGKSTWCGGRFRTEDLFSLDMFRRMLTGDVADQAATGEAARMLHLVVAYRMTAGLATVVDACNTRPEHRAPMIDEARSYGVPVLAVVMATPPAVCRVRNAARDGVFAPYPGANATAVPDEVVERLHREALATPPRVGEVDAVLTVAASGVAVRWEGCLPPAVLAAPWLADTMAAPFLPATKVLRIAPDNLAEAWKGQP